MNGRIDASRTDGVLTTVENWTGDKPPSCPWASLRDPFVARVLTAYRYWENGQLAFIEPHPSHRLVEGLTHYNYVESRMIRMKHEADMEKREQESRGN